MIELKDKKLFFAGRGDKVEKSELDRFIVQSGAELTEDIKEAEIIIEGLVIPAYLEDLIYERYKEGVKCIYIHDFEKFFSNNVEVDSILMAVKISKDKDRIIRLLKNDYFNDDVFIKLASFYDFENKDLYDNDDNRDVCIAIVERFCELVKTNHNIQYSPIGIYYTVLEATNPKLLELIYSMPEYEISDKNIKEDQPTKLREVVALNPNTSKQLQIQIMKNGDLGELKFLAMNESLFAGVKKALVDMKNSDITIALIKAKNYDITRLKELIEDTNLRSEVFKYIELNSELFSDIVSKDLNEDELISLSLNESLDNSMIDRLFEFSYKEPKLNLLANPNISKEKISEYINSSDVEYLYSLGFNPTLSEDEFYKLFNLDILEVNIALAYNKKTPHSIYRSLSQKKIFEINSALASNEAVPLDVLLQYQFDYRVKVILGKNEAYKEYTKRTLI